MPTLRTALDKAEVADLSAANNKVSSVVATYGRHQAKLRKFEQC